MKKIKKTKKKKVSAAKRGAPPAGRQVLPAKIAPAPPGEEEAAQKAGDPGQMMLAGTPVMTCPNCGGVWFVDIVSYRMVPPEKYAPGNPDAKGWRRARAVVCQCVGCRQWVHLPREGVQ